jgi:hypothetical protein
MLGCSEDAPCLSVCLSIKGGSEATCRMGERGSGRGGGVPLSLSAAQADLDGVQAQR